MGSWGHLSLAVMSDESDAVEWLGVEVESGEKTLALPGRVQEYLLKGFKADVWTMEDVPDSYQFCGVRAS